MSGHDGPPQYSPVNDLAELCAVAVHRLTASAGDALRMRAVLLRLRDGLDIGMDDSRHALVWRDALDRWLGGGMPGTPTGKALAERTEQIATAQRQVLELDAENARLRERDQNASAVVAQQAMENTALVTENARLRAELDARDNPDANVNIVPGDRAMLERVLAGTGWQPDEGEVVRAAADGYQVTRRGGAWVPE